MNGDLPLRSVWQSMQIFTNPNNINELFSFFGQVPVFSCRKKPTYFTINKYLATVDDCNNNKSCLL